MNFKILCISDTHGLHNKVPLSWLKPADMIIHAGDVSNRGYIGEIENFLIWFSNLNQYKYKIFIAGNHDWGFQDHPKECKKLIKEFNDKYPKNFIIYLQDESINIGGLKFYGSPWQPEFCNWAFNLKRGEELRDKWSMIPKDIDVLITHGPVYGINDQVIGRKDHLGCQDLYNRVIEIKPKLHLCGHIHSGYGCEVEDETTFINASVLNERYEISYKPVIFEI